MEYELYTVPKCDGCDAVKQFLDERKINYSVWNLREPEHRKYYGKVYTQIDGKLKRNVSDKKAILPLLVKVDGARNVEKFAQELDEIKRLFG